MNVRQFLAKYNEQQGYDSAEGCLIETLIEVGQVVWEDPVRDEHRWYICVDRVKDIDGTYIKYTDYIITGDTMYDMGLEYDLDEAEIVERKERTVVEVYYE